MFWVRYSPWECPGRLTHAQTFTRAAAILAFRISGRLAMVYASGQAPYFVVPSSAVRIRLSSQVWSLSQLSAPMAIG